RLSWISLDIETEGLDGRLYSIAAAAPDQARVFVLGDQPVACAGAKVSHHGDERALLDAFFDWLQLTDPDLILGWNLVNFDLDFLEKRCRRLGRGFDFGRGGEHATILTSAQNDGPSVARLPGRVALDGIELLRAAFWSFESFELEHVAQVLLGRGKHIDTRVESKVD
ncbi:MAG: DNA polymerase II, partial [Gammaproteobacteria bacterium]|nr:DNA polymerase II [Gammaproteobacteria bacterium]